MPPHTPLLDPTDYFERAVDPIVAGLGVFVLYVLVEFATVMWLASWVLDRAENAPDAAQGALRNIMPAFFFGFIVTAVVAIAVVTVLMHYLPSGENVGSIRDTLAVAGWAYAPNLIAVPINFAWIRYDLRDVTFSGADPQTFQAELDRMNQEIVGVVDFSIELMVVIWSVIILAYGVAAVHDLEVRDTAKAAIVVGVGSLVLALVV